MKMIHYVLLTLCLMFSTPSFALNSNDLAEVGFNDLTDIQKAEIVRQVSSLKAKESDTTNTAKQVNEWVEVGANIGKGLAGAAKELGVAVNEFANTPVGKMVSFLIIWHFFGIQVIHILAAVLVVVVWAVSVRYFLRQHQHESIVYDEKNQDIFKRNRIKTIQRGGVSGGVTFLAAMFTGVSLAAAVGLLISV